MAIQHKLVWAIAAMHCLAAISFGYNTSITSPAITAIAEHFDFAAVSDSSGSGTHGGDTTMQSIVVSSILVGCIISALLTGAIADAVGRFPVLIATNVLYIIGEVICVASVHVWMLNAGRLILGFGVGMASVVVPLIIGEISPPSIRGQIGIMNQLGVTIGILVAYILGAVFSNIPDSNVSWRVSLAIPLAFAAVHLVGCFFVRKESPRWLVMKNRVDDARDSLRFFRQTDDVEEELSELQKVQQGEEAPSLLEQVKLVNKPARPLIIVVGIMFLQQITGINAILYYLTTFLENSGMTEKMAMYMSILIGGINVIMTIVSVVLVDRAGRKPLLMYSLIGMTASELLIGAFSYVSGGSLSEGSAGAGSVVFTIMFVVFFAFGMGAVPWCLVPEVFPVKTRALAVSISLFTNWGTNLGVSLAFLSLVSATSMAAVFWGFAVLGLLGAVFVHFVIPETKGRSVEVIVKAMEDSKSWIMDPIPLVGEGSSTAGVTVGELTIA